MQKSLSELRSQVERLTGILATALEQKEPEQRYRDFLNDQVTFLQNELRNAATPETYRVAVIGSFKVGKSSFVNALCDVTRLVSVATNPETAAVSTLRYSNKAYARIRMIKQATWQAMRADYERDPSHPATMRFAALQKKEKTDESKSATGDGKEKQLVNLAELEHQYLTLEGSVYEVTCADWTHSKAQQSFSKEIARFTSQSSPAHFFVDQIEIYAPVPFLRDGIELIDTPGLNDPDRYRVHLTEQLVEDVDAVLFLTQSGRSYSQQDKDFIISQLRKGKLKHLMIIVTRCDETYASAVKDAEDAGDEPPAFDEHLKREEQRLRDQIKMTLDELLSDPQLRDDLGEYYLEKLLDIRVNFTSADYYRSGKKENDQTKLMRSGIEQLRTDLTAMLAQSERIVRSKKILTGATERVVERTRRTFKARRESISREFDIEHVRIQLTQIDEALHTKLADFETFIQEQVQLFRRQNRSDAELVTSQVNVAVLQANDIAREYEMQDIARHWRTRRNYGWGALHDIQNKTANRIFPQVEQILRRSTTRFEQLLGRTHSDLERLQAALAEIEQTIGVDVATPSLQLTVAFDQAYARKRDELEAHVAAQKVGIARRLDAFVSDEVQDEIDAAQERVATELGRGTTERQNRHVRTFYDDLRHRLAKELETFLQQSITAFTTTLEETANLIYPDLKHDLSLVIEDRYKAIESSLTERNEHQKEELSGYVRHMLKDLDYFQQTYEEMRASA